MMLTAIIAEAATQSGAATTPVWVVPVLTGTAGLLGTIVGGLITWGSTRSADKRKEAADARRENFSEIKDVAVRFLRTLSDQGFDSMKLKEFAEKNAADIDELWNTPSKASDELANSSVQTKPNGDGQQHKYVAKANELLRRSADVAEEPDEEVKQEKIRALNTEVGELKKKLEELLRRQKMLKEKTGKVKALLKALGELTESAKIPDAILTEMYLILPMTTISKAEKAASAVLARQLAAYLLREDRPNYTDSRDAIHAFIADIRRLLGKEKFIPQLLDTSKDVSGLVARIVASDDPPNPEGQA